MASKLTKPVEVFLSYAHQDEKLLGELNKHLAKLKRQGVITDWYDRDISVGKEWNDEIRKHLDSASVILLLISPDFMNSDYSNDVEVKRAMERHAAGEARVIPIILRPVDWEGAPFRRLHALPTDAKAVTLWNNLDDAFSTITHGIRKIVRETAESSRSSSSGQIPRSLTVSYVSRRDREGKDLLEQLNELLRPSKNNLVALWGAGGVGKTTLASETARNLAEAFSQRVVWVGADKHKDLSFSVLLDEIATQLGNQEIRLLSAEEKKRQVNSLLTAAPTLLVVDNFEIVSSNERPVILEFLQHTQCSTLITTRERIERARLIPVSAMSYDEANELLEGLISQTLNRDVFDKINRDQLLRTAEFNPLIIHWIVAQIDLAQDPEEVLSDLAHGEGDAADRVFDRSFNLKQLDNGGRAVLLALSLFVPSASRPALADVAGMGKEKDRKKFKEAQRTLSSLWLINQIEGGQRLAVEGLNRELARTRLANDPRSSGFRMRYIDRFLRYAEAHSTGTAQHLNSLELEKENLLNAMDFAFELRAWRKVIKIYSALEKFLDLRGYWDDFFRRGEQAIAAARALNDVLGVARFSGNSATILMRRGEHGTAKQIYQQALRDFREGGSSKGIAGTLHQLGVLAQTVGDLKEAQNLYLESLEINKHLGEKSNIASTLHQLGMIAQENGNLTKAQELYFESLEMKNDLGDKSGVASTLNQLGVLAQSRGDLQEAKDLYGQSLTIKMSLGDQSSIASILHNLGMIARGSGQIDEAQRLFQESLEIENNLGNQTGIATTLHQLGLIAEDRGDPGRAKLLYQESLMINQSLGEQRGIAVNLWQLGRLNEAENSHHAALEDLVPAYEIFQALGHPSARATLEDITQIFDTVGSDKFSSLLNSLRSDTQGRDIFRRVLGAQHKRAERLMYQGRWREAREILENNRVHYKRLLDRLGFAKTLLALAQAEQAIGDLERARWTYKDALDHFGDLDERHQALTAVYLGRLELQTGLVEDATTHLKAAEQHFAKVSEKTNLTRVRKLLDAARQMASKQLDDQTWASTMLNDAKLHPKSKKERSRG